MNRIEELEAEVARLRERIAELEEEIEEYSVNLDYILSDISSLHEELDTIEEDMVPPTLEYVMDKLEDMFECDVEGEKKYGKMLADLRGEPPRPTIYEMTKRIAALEEALRPFARVCDIIPVDDGDAAVQTVVYGTISLPAGQFRAARAVLEGDAPKLPDEIESYFRRTLADPAMKRDVKEFVKATRPTAEDMSRRIGDAPKEEHPIDKANREADEYRRRLQKEFEAANKDCPDCGDRDCGEITCPRWRERLARYLGAR